eukprot:GHRQ01028704.1.p1 GENE.GHRQ01028704.1~~GHRQ01028704.1.p1  ORF type:complete len:111 (-),score=20.89 GHRQ01028704.1:318-650(-)
MSGAGVHNWMPVSVAHGNLVTGSPCDHVAGHGSTSVWFQITACLVPTCMQMAKINNVGVHNLSPGMVTTELLMSGANTPTAKFFINCLGGCRSDVCSRRMSQAYPQETGA